MTAIKATETSKIGVQVQSIKNLQTIFLICVGVICVFILTGIQSGIQQPIVDHSFTKNSNLYVTSNDEGTSEVVRERRDDLFLEYMNAIGTLERMQINKKTKRLPDIIGIGAEKCGTEALRQLLSSHPLIKSPDKESNFFGGHNYDLGPDYYRDLMPKVSPYELIFEKTSEYFVQGVWTPYHMHKILPNAKLILVLCDPANRTYSDYVQEISNGKVESTTSFDELMGNLLTSYLSSLNYQKDDDDNQIQYISKIRKKHPASDILTTGMYYYHLLKWYKYYNTSEIHIVDGEELMHNPAKVVKELQAFLGIPEFLLPDDITQGPDGFYCFSPPFVVNIQGKLRVNTTKPKCLDRDTKEVAANTNHGTPYLEAMKKIKRFYLPFNQKLFELLGKKFHW
ncbi:heparan sulfate glucosamine 3-O-sulfotransferase 1-like [Styela clava]